jgi:Protein of unknown function (DUF4232)
MRKRVLVVAAAAVVSAVAGSALALHNPAKAEAATLGSCAIGNLSATATDEEMFEKGGEFFENVRLTYTNESSATCTLSGNPVVALTGPTTGGWKQTVNLPATGTATTLTLARGESAHSTIRVRLLPEEEHMWQPAALRVRLQGTAATASVAWPEGLTIRQENKTLPGLGLPNSVGAPVLGA